MDPPPNPSYPPAKPDLTQAHAQSHILRKAEEQQARVPLTAGFGDPFPPPLDQSSALPTSLPAPSSETKAASTVHVSRRVDPYHLAPEDAIFSPVSPPRRSSTNIISGGDLLESRASRQSLRPSYAASNASRSMGAIAPDSRSRSRRRRRRTWKKLLWVKQSFPDNYTDQATFLENLQRNPRLKPYEFWPLVADSTVIVQHVYSVIIFIVCFVGIFQERVSPVAVVGGGSFATCLGWLMWERWAGWEQDPEAEAAEDALWLSGGGPDGQLHHSLPRRLRYASNQSNQSNLSMHSAADTLPAPQHQPQADLKVSPKPSAYPLATPAEPTPRGVSSATSSTASLVTPNDTHSGHANGYKNNGLSISANGSAHASSANLWQKKHLHSASALSLASVGTNGAASALSHSHASEQPPPTPATPRYPPPRRPLGPQGGRARHRLTTMKSAVLIYFTLLGLSPILKSLTRSTSSDSIWSMSFWLLAINIFFFDYSGVWVGAHKFPVASLSTNAALMASTVLASRLPSTGQVFSLTLFSIEVFGLFPVFRRYARHHSWRYHIALTVLLVLGAGAGVGIIVASGGNEKGWPWQRAVVGMIVACVLSAVVMGGCSWWLIGLQKYKNEIYGPWDPARPIISRRHWNDV